MIFFLPHNFWSIFSTRRGNNHGGRFPVTTYLIFLCPVINVCVSLSKWNLTFMFQCATKSNGNGIYFCRNPITFANKVRVSTPHFTVVFVSLLYFSFYDMLFKDISSIFHYKGGFEIYFACVCVPFFLDVFIVNLFDE